MSTTQQAMQAFEGKFVDLRLRFADGREKGLFGLRVLSVGSGGFVLEDSWPISVRHAEVESVQLADTGMRPVQPGPRT